MNDFKKIYSKYKNQVYFFVKRYVSGNEDVEDLVQEIFVHLWKHNAHLANSNNQEQIIFKTAKQEIANFYRKNKLIYSSVEDISETKLIKLDENDDESLFLENINKIESLIEKLPHRTKEFFLKNKLENVSYAKLAEEYNISKTAVGKHVEKALRFIKANALFFLSNFICITI